MIPAETQAAFDRALFDPAEDPYTETTKKKPVWLPRAVTEFFRCMPLEVAQFFGPLKKKPNLDDDDYHSVGDLGFDALAPRNAAPALRGVVLGQVRQALSTTDESNREVPRCRRHGRVCAHLVPRRRGGRRRRRRWC